MKQNYAKIISGVILAGLLTFTSCQSTHEMAKADYRVAKVEGRMIDIDAKWDAHRCRCRGNIKALQREDRQHDV